MFPCEAQFNAYVYDVKPEKAFISRESLSIATFLDDDGLFLAASEYQCKINFLDLAVRSSYLAMRYYPFCTIYPHFWSEAV